MVYKRKTLTKKEAKSLFKAGGTDKVIKAEKYGMHIFGGTSGDHSVGIPSMCFEFDLDSNDQMRTKDWIETLDAKCYAPGFNGKKYREYVRWVIKDLINELHDNGKVNVKFEDEIDAENGLWE